jgi:integrase
LLLDFVFQTMMRADELAYIEYADIRDGILNIQNKNKWHPKKHHQRQIRLGKELLASITARRKTVTSTYLFRNRVGGPNKHLLRVIERIAKRAGIIEDATLHRARRTSITLYSGETNPQTIQKLAGHKDLRTTMRYLVAYEANSKQMQEATENVSRKLKSARTTAASDAA